MAEAKVSIDNVWTYQNGIVECCKCGWWHRVRDVKIAEKLINYHFDGSQADIPECRRTNDTK